MSSPFDDQIIACFYFSESFPKLQKYLLKMGKSYLRTFKKLNTPFEYPLSLQLFVSSGICRNKIRRVQGFSLFPAGHTKIEEILKIIFLKSDKYYTQIFKNCTVSDKLDSFRGSEHPSYTSVYRYSF